MPRTLNIVKVPPVTDPMDAPAVVSLTERFLELRQEVFRNLVDRAVELGELLVKARGLLRGHYQRWLADRLSLSGSTAANYVAMAHLAARRPGVIQRWKELGPSKLYQIARLPDGGRAAVLRTPQIAKMTDAEFSVAVAPHVVRHRRVTGNMKAHGLRMKVQGFAQRLAAARVPRIEDPAIRAGLRRDLTDLGRRALRLARSV